MLQKCGGNRRQRSWQAPPKFVLESNQVNPDPNAPTLQSHKDIISHHRRSINSLQLDLTEGRYLLSGAFDASAAVFDVQCGTNYVDDRAITRHKCLFAVDKQHEHGRKYAVSSSVWYAVDTGLFVTGSYDHHINVWDMNTTQVVMDFKMPGKVYRTAVSPLPTTHMLIAAGTEDVQVRLCDIASGAFAHTLSGHRSMSRKNSLN